MRPADSRIQTTLRALRHRNYRLFFIGQGISTIGTWMQQIAMSWLVYRLTHSPFLLGAAGFVDKIPAFFITPFAGVFLDRANRHRVVFVTQSLLLLQALVLGALALSGAVRVWHLFALAAFLGLVNALDIPARQAFVVEMIEDPEDLGNAIALNSTLFNGARLIGPSLAGILLGFTNEGVCFVLNALSYLALIVALCFMRIAPREVGAARGAALQQFKEGFAYAFGFAPARAILLLLALVSLMGMPYAVLMPVFATQILHGGPRTLGFLMAAMGCGAVVGAVYLASRRTVLGLGRWIAAASALFGLGLLAFSFSRWTGLSLALLVFTGFGMMVHLASSNTILQTLVDDDKRGRVMSFYVMSITGMAPFGNLLAGSLASRIGAAGTLKAGGLACVAGAALFATQLPEIRRLVRPIYERKGILPQEPIQSGLGIATGLESLEE